MNSLTSLQRKLVYLGGILFLFIFILLLGMPAAPGAQGSFAAKGGRLAQLRQDYQLGETSMGNVDPTSATMNFVLLGMRGLAAAELWNQANENLKKKEWAELRAATESIILLQPHFIKVWKFQGWNLAFNVSAEWDKVEDRYYWVKEGIKFLKRGVARNKKQPELYWDVGDTLGKKIGRADEVKHYRGYFEGRPGYPDPEPDPNDPEPDIRKRRRKYPGGFDTEINPDGQDNYLVAREYFVLSSEVEKTAQRELKLPQVQHIMADVLFRTYPVRSLTDYAMAMQREGRFDERCREAWLKAYNGWVNDYGQEEFDTEAGRIHLQLTDEEQKVLEQEMKAAPPPAQTRLWWVMHYDRMTNFSYWRRRCKMEQERNTDDLIPTDVEPGDRFTITLNGKSISYKATSADPGDVVRGLASLWAGMREPEFDEIRAEPAERRDFDGKLQPALRLTWNQSSITHEPVLAASNGGENDTQKLERKVHTRAIVEAHRELYEGEVAHFSSDLDKARQLISSGLQKFEKTLREYPDFLHDDDLVEEIMLGIHEWRESLTLNEEKPEDDDPLLPVWKFLEDPKVRESVRADTERLTSTGMNFLEAERQVMVKHHPLNLMMTIHTGKQTAIEQEYNRRRKNFTAPTATVKKP